MTDKPRVRHIRLTADDRRAALINAALSCIAEGGIAAFTVDRICARAGVLRGLVGHHFGSMEALLTAVCARIHATVFPVLPPDRPRILTLLDHLFSGSVFNRQTLNIRLTLWSEISNTPALRAEHRQQCAACHRMVTDALRQVALALATANSLARSLICLVDGLGLQHCIDPDTMTAAQARQACLDLITPHTGPLA